MNRGCIPVKALVRSAEIAHLARRAPEFGLKRCDAEPDFQAVFAHKDGVIAMLSHGEELLKERGISLLRGSARFTSPNTIQIDGREVHSGRFVIATGSAPDIPRVSGLTEAGYWTSDEAIYPDRQPSSLVVMGGSAVGCELAQIYARLGTAVTVIEMKDRLLPSMDPVIARTLAEAFKDEGITVISGAEVTHAGTGEGGKTVRFKRQGKEESITASEILVATGRHPDLDGLGLESAGVDYGSQGVTVNTYLQTSQANIWACGDAIGKPMLAHFATYEGRIAGRNCMSGSAGLQKVDHSIVPKAVFTDPPVASAGLDEEAARERGHEVSVGIYTFAETGRAVAMGETRGIVKLVAERHTKEILGAHIIGPGADIVIHEVVVALGSRLTVSDLREPKAIHIHPTLSEALTWAADEIG